MSDKSFSRQVIDALLPPKGTAWAPAPGKGMDLFLDGMGNSAEIVRLDLADLSVLRDPLLTPILDELETEHGILNDDSIAEATRRATLAAKMFSVGGTGTEDDLQAALDAAGFNLLVHVNSPAVDPALFLAQNFAMWAAGITAFAGGASAYAAFTGGELVVNGDIVQTRPNYTAVAGGVNSFAAGTEMYAGAFDELIKTLVTYQIPTDPGDWPLVFFVGGAATRDGSGFLTSIDTAIVDTERRDELIETIVRIKPLHSWCGLIADFN